MKIQIISAGDFTCDGGALFGVVPKKVWSKRYPCNEHNLCELTMRCILIESEDKKILIETGAGNKQADYLAYSDINPSHTIIQGLQKKNIDPHTITDVVLTHLHFDHCGGCTYYDALGELSPTFLNARHWVSQTQWDNYLHPNVREGNSYFPENMMPIAAAGLLELIKGNTSIAPGVTLKLFDGHSPGHIVPYINKGKHTLVYTGDVIPTAANIPLAWVSAYDTHPILSMESKKDILQQAAEQGHILLFEHDKHTECVSIIEEKGRWQAGPPTPLAHFL